MRFRPVPWLALCSLTLAACGAASETNEPSTTANAVTEGTRPTAAPEVRLDPERCEFVGLPARQGETLLVQGADPLDVDARPWIDHVLLSGGGNADPPLARALLSGALQGALEDSEGDARGERGAATTDDVTACCNGDRAACERERVEVDETLATLASVDVDRERLRSWDALRDRCPEPGDGGECFVVYAEYVTPSDERRRLLVDPLMSITDSAGVRLERQAGSGAWTTIEPATISFTGESCERLTVDSVLGAWVGTSTGLLVVAMAYEIPLQSDCEPGVGYLIFDPPP